MTKCMATTLSVERDVHFFIYKPAFTSIVCVCVCVSVCVQRELSSECPDVDTYLNIR